MFLWMMDKMKIAENCLLVIESIKIEDGRQFLQKNVLNTNNMAFLLFSTKSTNMAFLLFA